MNKDNKYITKQCTLNILQQYIYYNNTFITTIHLLQQYSPTKQKSTTTTITPPKVTGNECSHLVYQKRWNKKKHIYICIYCMFVCVCVCVWNVLIVNCNLYYQKLRLKYLCNFSRHWLHAPWGWQNSVETCSSVMICEIIVCIRWSEYKKMGL